MATAALLPVTCWKCERWIEKEGKFDKPCEHKVCYDCRQKMIICAACHALKWKRYTWCPNQRCWGPLEECTCQGQKEEKATVKLNQEEEDVRKRLLYLASSLKCVPLAPESAAKTAAGLDKAAYAARRSGQKTLAVFRECAKSVVLHKQTAADLKDRMNFLQMAFEKSPTAASYCDKLVAVYPSAQAIAADLVKHHQVESPFGCMLYIDCKAAAEIVACLRSQCPYRILHEVTESSTKFPGLQKHFFALLCAIARE